jgi:hypothetical protein
MSNEEGGCRYLRGTFQRTCGFCGCVFDVGGVYCTGGQLGGSFKRHD